MIPVQCQRNAVTEAKGEHFMKTLILAVVTALLPVAGFAQSPDCSAPQKQMDMNDCASSAYASADVLLNHTWKIAIRDAKNRNSRLENDEIPSEDVAHSAAHLDQVPRSGMSGRNHNCARWLNPAAHSIHLP